MEIYIIRHTTPNIEKGVCYGQTDLNLVDTYLEEFKTIKQQIPNSKKCTIKSSPLKRCALLANHLGSPVLFDDRLKELDFGDWEMKPWNDISEEILNPWMEDFVYTRVPNGESYIDLASRINSFFEDIIKSHDKQPLIIVSHAGPIRAFLSSVLNISLEKSFRIKIQYGDVFHLKKEDNSLKLISEIKI
ncbi:alpha-ribazole phosphatase [Flavivirga spongiicola]|uniref:Alpha-ribazole phosphatase n=1 Tax=Flavivirga spongiicola TaxID=421621 RepID=A0ABU7XPH6_9FLAO|nr:alpha-ribazole phosphatase [Flavivirga sp. MEBiC05379]MDO5977679.1 alpha-ribazole phosphatase [Flavivirga sp. MEBiC05379]